MHSNRLRYRPVTLDDLDDFHGLVVDEYIRRYLMDGEIFPREWSRERIEGNLDLFAERGVGLWLVHERETDELVGFCGFLAFPDLHPEPQLLYALREPFAGQGYATEMGRAAIAEARRRPGFETIIAGVDAPNAASVRVLEKLGFVTYDTLPGAFGDTFMVRLDVEPSTTADSRGER